MGRSCIIHNNNWVVQYESAITPHYPISSLDKRLSIVTIPNVSRLSNHWPIWRGNNWHFNRLTNQRSKISRNARILKRRKLSLHRLIYPGNVDFNL